MKILITGGSGIVGSRFLSLFRDEENILYAPSRGKLDITKEKDIKKNILDFRPQIIIHFAAYRDAGKAENERGNKKGLVWKTNVIATKNLLQYAKISKAYFIYISTDMVFSGDKKRKGPYREKALVANRLRDVSWYGWTKINAEKYVKEYKKSAIIRIGNVTMDRLEPAADYVGKMLVLFDEKKLYPLFNDQYLTLTYIPTLVSFIQQLIKSPKKGIYHIASSNLFTPSALADYLLEKCRGVKNIVQTTSINDYLKNYPKRYPQYAGLNTKITEKKFNITSETWQQIVNRFVKNTQV